MKSMSHSELSRRRLVKPKGSKTTDKGKTDSQPEKKIKKAQAAKPAEDTEMMADEDGDEGIGEEASDPATSDEEASENWCWQIGLV